MAKYIRFEAQGAVQYGILREERVETLSAAPWAGGRPTSATYGISEVRLLAPCQPTKIVCLGKNYREHAAEFGAEPPREPLLFLKAPSAVIGPEEAIVYPPQSRRVDYEGELALVMGKRCPPAGRAGGRLRLEENPLDYLFGCTCLNDVTARDLQKSDVQYTRAKGFDTFCPLGPLVTTGLDLANLAIETWVNGERRQQARTNGMVFPPDVIIRFISSVMTLEPGDVIATGTPASVGPLQAGDVVEVVIEGIGRLRNPVVAVKGD